MTCPIQDKGRTGKRHTETMFKRKQRMLLFLP
jgi:hypothetical protein